MQATMRAMPVMRATIQMLRIFTCYLYICMTTFGQIYFLFVFFWLFCLFKIAQDAQTNKNNMQKFIKIQDFSKTNFQEKHTAAALLEWVSIDTCHSLELHSMWNFIEEKKKKQHFNLHVLASRMVSKSRNFNRFVL